MMGSLATAERREGWVGMDRWHRSVAQVQGEKRGRRTAARSLILTWLVACSLVASPGTTVGNTVVYSICGAPHCYATINQGIDLSTQSYTLTSLSNGTAAIEAFCQVASASGRFADVEMWLITSPNPDPYAPGYHNYGWDVEWLEYGINTGWLQDADRSISFFWARQYWAPTYRNYLYHEYVGSGTPARYSGYTVSIRWNSAGYWDMYRSGVRVVTNIRTQQPPGSHQGLSAGSEMTTKYDQDSGEVYQLSYIAGGSNHSGWTGYVYVDPVVYTWDQSNTHLTFWAGC